MFQDGDELGKNLRILLNSWHFTYEERTKKSHIQTTSSIEHIYIPSTQEIPLSSITATTTTESISSSTTSNTEANEPPQSPESMPLTIDDQEEQPHDDTLQIHQPEQMNVAIEPSPSSIVPPATKPTTNRKKKLVKLLILNIKY